MNIKSILKSTTCFLLISFCFRNLFAQDTSSYNAPKIYSVDQLRQDFEIFKKAFQEAHPGLYSHVPKEKILEKFRESSKSLNHDMTELEFRKIIANTISYIKVGHSSSTPSDEFMDSFMKSAKILPLKVHYLKNKLYIVYSPNNIIPKGAELLSINNRPANEIINSIFLYLPSDGNMQTSKEWMINRQFSYLYYTFIEQAEKFSVEYANPDNTKNISIAAISENKDSAVHMSYIPKGSFYSLQYLNDTIPLLTIKLFIDDNNDKQKFPGFLDSVFREIKRKESKNLIIDLRESRGGEDEYGALLYSYLTNVGFHYFKKIETVTDSIAFLQYTDADSSFNKQLRESVNKIGSHLYVLKTNQHPQLSIQKPQKNFFSGRVFILINGESFSTTADVSSIIHAHERGKFIGEETGGNALGNCSGIVLTLTLPNTKMKVHLPLYKYTNAVPSNTNKNRGVMPDYPFSLSINDIINENDTILQYALELMK